ncbi:double-strand break repair helicase AddA [Phenylobacterium sp. J367]|uniref:double-strand break repair helicase AddA n=1 Tax=Phenylobacterium sp. J367 TaxID=2898435 RepID=UPI002151932F|nr:double-strand break repair helicase AddA [Phenylobacterium sp. J367]MCR5878349.1 double-strand break repair helicase AddA [Phenylobacterium sp. J367]
MSEIRDRAANSNADPQQLAADPTLSAFVTANAGSGKTKTLIDRVARLLLAGAEPATILCVTYTKAAASEMQRRLFDLLGDWSVMAGAELAEKLHALDGRRVDPQDEAQLSDARRLFARALQTPGGLKIQTIHAFCEKLLRRFPLEAGISPSFRVMDDSGSAAVARSAKALVAHHALKADDQIAAAYARFSVALDFQSFEAMFADFEARRGALAEFFHREGGLAGAEAWVWRAVDVARGSTVESLEAEAVAALDRGLWRRAAETLQRGGATDQKCAAQIAAVAANPDATFAEALLPFFTEKGEGSAATWVGKTSGLKADEGLRALLLAEQARLEAARERLRAVQVAWETLDALTLASAYLAAYRLEKDAAGLLDFADLIEKACHLLRDRPAAAWVLYKLDGGIDHILLDEAQDTAPDQWTIIDQITAEFFAGAGVGGEARLRDLFVVGDPKQSIYSFQGARPEQLRHKLTFHRDRATGAGFRFEEVELVDSWRSTPQVLSFVDAVFTPPGLARSIQPGLDEAVRHQAQRREHTGCVDVWPLEVERKGDEREAWDAPLDAEAEDSANRRLARRIADEIKALVARGDAVFDKETRTWRAAHYGDVLILVRRRRALFEEILRALKQRDVPVAGADRLALSQHIIFDDLVALARFVLFPGDELTLAALLKSPLCGLDDDSLYQLAHGRKDETLWARLVRRSGERDDWQVAHAFLQLALTEAKARRPFELYAVLLGVKGADGLSMRQRLLRRLGAEAEDALDEFMNQVLAAETRGVHSLEGLAAELAGLDIVVKREMEGAEREVRVMTAHGAKGLEAPIVFLPETTLTQTARGSPLLPVKDGFLWCGSSARDCEATSIAREARAAREEAEAYRLLYVALTRARDRLVLCGRIAERTDPEKLRGWWGAIREALDHADILAEVREVESAGLHFRRYGHDPATLPPETAAAPAPAALPAWTATSPPAEAFARYASPSELGQGVKVPAPSPLAEAGGLGRFRRGDLVHRLLQILPDLPAGGRADGARALLTRERDLTEAQRAEMIAAALSVLEDARFAEVFGDGSRAEVAIAGTAAALPPGLRISGRIDRLVVLPDRVLVVDFKTNRPSPDRIEDAGPAYLRQMALYAAVLAEVFPGRRIEAALVWTDGPKLMPVPENLLAATLADLRRTG